MDEVFSLSPYPSGEKCVIMNRTTQKRGRDLWREGRKRNWNGWGVRWKPSSITTRTPALPSWTWPWRTNWSLLPASPRGWPRGKRSPPTGPTAPTPNTVTNLRRRPSSAPCPLPPTPSASTFPPGRSREWAPPSPGGWWTPLATRPWRSWRRPPSALARSKASPRKRPPPSGRSSPGSSASAQ